MSKIVKDIITEINNINYNYLIVPISILNVLDQDDRFQYLPFGDVSGITKVGNFMWYEVYLDVLMPPNEILIYCDKSIMRDNKIDFLLDDTELLKEKRVSITNP